VTPDIRRVAAGRSLAAFARTYLGPAANRRHFEQAAPWLHRWLFRQLDRPAPWSLAVAAPRGSGKTTVCSLAFALREALTNLGVHLILMAHASQQAAAKNLADVKREIESNELLRGDYPAAEGEPWNVGEAIVKRLDGSECLIKTVGPSTRIRGVKFGASRPDVIILDDAQQDEPGTPEQAERFAYWCEGTLFQTVAPTSRIVEIGNLTSYGTLLGQRLAGTAFLGPDGPYGHALPGEPRFASWTRARFQAVTPNGASYWPERYPTEWLEDKRRSLTPHVWSAEYQNDPLDPSTATFATDLFRSPYGAAPHDGTAARSPTPRSRARRAHRVRGKIDHCGPVSSLTQVNRTATN